jgi:hypothetical protein
MKARKSKMAERRKINTSKISTAVALSLPLVEETFNYGRESKPPVLTLLAFKAASKRTKQVFPSTLASSTEPKMCKSLEKLQLILVNRLKQVFIIFKI